MKRRDFLKTSLAAGAGLMAYPALSHAASLGRAAGDDRPNIVLILADDMGFSDIGCYGSEISTPHLDRLASSGLRFSQFYNCARCCPTRASLLSGLYPHQAGVGHMTEKRNDDAYEGYLSRDCVTIAEALKPAGYHTLMAGKWHVGMDPGMWPVDRGFEQYFGILQGSANYFRPNPRGKLALGRELVEPGEHFYTTDAFTDHALGFVDKSRGDGKPYFLYLAFNAPHWPLHAWPEDIAKYEGKYMKGWDVLRQERYEKQVSLGLIDSRWPLSRRDREAPPWNAVDPLTRKKMAHKMAVYAAMVDRLDQNVGRLLKALEAAGDMDNTVIMFLSDNGASHEFGPFGMDFIPGAGPAQSMFRPAGGPDTAQSYGRSWSNAGNTPFRLHKHWTHEGGISTPLIVHWPRVIRQAGQITGQVGHVIDLMATCIDLAQAKYPENCNGHAIKPLEGLSLVPVFEGQTRAGHESICWEHEGNRGVRMGKWKIVSDYPGGWGLFDMEADRTETRNLAHKHPDKVKEMAAVWTAWAERVGVRKWNPLWAIST